MATKVRIHREWFQDTRYGMCDCNRGKRDRREQGFDLTVYVWGNYVGTTWHTISRVCEGCFKTVVLPHLVLHAGPCGCQFALQPRSGHSLPPWITLEGSSLACKVA